MGTHISAMADLKVTRICGAIYEASMDQEEFYRFYPLLDSWLRKTLVTFAGSSRKIVSCGFPRLPLYFSTEMLASANVVLVDKLPVPPLSSWGLKRFAELERGNFDGITYLDTFFLKHAQSRNEAIHFHELIHVAQWRILGPERFLYSYANGFERYGYRDSPLEVMAYDAEAVFRTSAGAFDAEKFVAEKLAQSA